ncbi:MAG: META domain-containing protein [Bacteroidota bacterium]
MRKNSIYGLILIFGMTLLGMSCQEEIVDVDLTLNTWKVEKIKRRGSGSFEKTENTYFLKFRNDSTLTIGLEVNTCIGHYSIPQAGNIEIASIGCTKACCDSEYAEALIQLFQNVTDYYLKGEELYMEGDGEIVLIQIVARCGN